ncbi:hypothetical protein MKZ38_003938 [Zalerion maritima]|uniref:alpha-1,2-Mannosidase n=1 Tax=Zalerion maritima TaxID=339359 RepID=A0AAD5RLZ5_9PEZI|nr:hypothetical protein MKZ38_003938 [Zalerion maritima]
MMRFRRYRVFAALSFVIIFLLYKSSRPVSWDLDWKDTPSPGGEFANKNPEWNRDPEGYRNKLDIDVKGNGGSEEEKPLENVDADKTEDVTEEKPSKVVAETSSSDEAPTLSLEAEVEHTAAVIEEEITLSIVDPASTKTEIPTIPKVKPGGQHEAQSPAGGKQLSPLPTPVHWTPLPEKFPLSPDEVITLPTAASEPIPQIQSNFGEEDAESKSIREERLAKVKVEMQHAWDGYTKYAWGHDELTPVSLMSKDPFCGWAATLVDSLDTLWMMGMKQEFDNAVKAVGKIDFTYSPYRPEIPVFETTIRYLGGLVGAYDISGGVSTNKDYGILLDKAGELADILMGIFDTPNRMPILYYDYRPEFASKPKLASTRAGVAELGSLLMEFTRLAQLSGKQKYYDAVARVTNALDDLGKRGTSFPGLFPEVLDISGCNRTVEPQEETKEEYDQVIPGLNPSLSKDHESEDAGDSPTDVNGAARDEHEQVDGKVEESDTTTPQPNQKVKRGPTGSSRNALPFSIEDCRPQPVVSANFGSDSYSIGGSQDSTYEYFPKEWLLLGAKEPQYKALAIDALEATKNHLLFRPMTLDDRDILFAAKIILRKGGDPDYLFESSHLACFVGGMFGMSGKLFENEEYVDLGKRLTDGCVWAYESFPSGIMPENSRVVPCKDPYDCPWNETIWHDWIDPMGEAKDKQQKQYDERQALRMEEEKAEAETAKTRTAGDDEAEKRRKDKTAQRQADQFAGAVEAEAARQAKLLSKGSLDDAATKVSIPDEDIAKDVEKIVSGTAANSKQVVEEQNNKGSDDHDDPVEAVVDVENEKSSREGKLLGRRDIPSDAIDTAEVHAHDVTAVGDSNEMAVTDSLAPDSKTEDEDEDSTPAPKTKEEAEALAANPPPIKEASTKAQQPVGPYDPEHDPHRPLNHKEFVAKRIKDERLQPGFVSIPGKNYILRPEAIESVWYMYRITGDKIWQDKGWRMFESIMKATKTEGGHSAIADVTSKISPQNDSMESFWLAETLKYFYLLFAEPDLISLDDWVLNTEAHAFRRPHA